MYCWHGVLCDFFFKQKTAYEMRISDWSSDVCSSDLLGNMLAGLQIALTQPIRIDDVLVLENEWGRVEEITGTYVVVAIWDQRRLIVPLQYFIETPFQNWTRHSSQILGTAMLWTDYRLPVAPIRAEVQNGSGSWREKGWQ